MIREIFMISALVLSLSHFSFAGECNGQGTPSERPISSCDNGQQTYQLYCNGWATGQPYTKSCRPNKAEPDDFDCPTGDPRDCQ